MRRLFYLTLGAAAGVAGAYYVTRKVTELRQSSPVVSLAATAIDKARDGSLPTARSWRAEFARNRALREAELREALSIPDGEQVDAARERWGEARSTSDRGRRRTARSRASRHPAAAPSSAGPGGIKPEDFDDPLYEF